MKLDRTEIGVLVVLVLAIVTVNAYMRVKAVGRQEEARQREHAARMLDAGSPADAARE